MLNLMKYLLFIVVSIFFYSCGSEYSEIKKDKINSFFFGYPANTLDFYKSNQLSKRYIFLGDDKQIFEIHNFNDKKLSFRFLPDSYIELQDSIEYYGNGKIKTRGYLKDGEKHSLWSYFDRNGHLLVERYFSYGRPSNIWIWYDHHHDNQIIHFEIYEDFRDNGTFTRYYQSGCIKDIKSYSDNKLNGPYTLYNNDCKENPSINWIDTYLGFDTTDYTSNKGSIKFKTHYYLGKEVENN